MQTSIQNWARTLLAGCAFVAAGRGSLSAQAVAAPANPAQHLQHAHELLALKQPGQAVAEFRAVLQAEPDNIDANANLGVLLYFNHDYTSAEPLLTRAVAARPVSKLKALLGLAQRRNGHPDEARATLTSALPELKNEQASIFREVGLELIELDSASNDLPAAAAIAAQLKTRLPEDPGVLYAAYRINTDLANEAMLDLSIAAPTSGQMHQAMAHELSRERDLKGAIANYRAALAADPGLPGGHYELAEVLRQSTEPAEKAEAEQQYQLALKTNPSDFRSITRLGDFAAERGEHDTAISMYRHALEFSSDNTDANVGLAHELVETNHLTEALPILQSLEKADPTDVLVHFRLAALYRRLKRPDDVRREVAAYEKYKAIKEQMHALYQEMRLDAPGTIAAQP